MEQQPEIWKVFVGGLSWTATEEQLRAHFSQFGPLRNCLVMLNPVTGKPRGFGFVECLSRETMEAIVNHPEHIIDGRVCEVKRAVPKEVVYQRQEEQRGTKIFVGGLSWDASEESVKSVFEKYGPVLQVQIMRDHETHKPRGFAFVTFENEETVNAVCAKEIFEIDGKTCGVKRAEPRFGGGAGGGRSREGGYDDRYGYGYGRGGPAYGPRAAYGYGVPPPAYPPAYQQYYAAPPAPAGASAPAGWPTAADPYGSAAAAAYYAAAPAVDPSAAAGSSASYYAQAPAAPAAAGYSAPPTAAYYAAAPAASYAAPPADASRARYHPYR